MADYHHIVAVRRQFASRTVGHRHIIKYHARFKSERGYNGNRLIGDEIYERILRLFLYSFLDVFSMCCSGSCENLEVGGISLYRGDRTESSDPEFAAIEGICPAKRDGID